MFQNAKSFSTRCRALRDEIPEESILNQKYADYAYKDSFEVEIKREDVAKWEIIAALFHSAPPWFDVLAQLRDRIVSVFGLKTSVANPKQTPPPYHDGREIGFFRILEQNEHEVILGNDDKHLDFRMSLMLTQKEGSWRLSASTVVSTKNLGGSVYFSIVKPFRRIILPIMTRGMANIVEKRALPKTFYEAMKVVDVGN